MPDRPLPYKTACEQLMCILIAMSTNDAQIDGKLRYRVLTGVDDSAFCERVSQALADGYVLHGSPAITNAGKNNIVAQAIILPEAYDRPSIGFSS